MAMNIQSNTSNISNTTLPAKQQPIAAKDNVTKKDVNQPSINEGSTENFSKVDQTQPTEIPEKTDISFELPRESVQEAVNKLQDYVDKYNRDLTFSIDDDTGRTIIRLLDGDSNVVKQYPSEDVLSLINNLEQNKGLFIGKA